MSDSQSFSGFGDDDDDAFGERIRTYTLKELMTLSETAQGVAQSRKSILAAVKDGDLSALEAYEGQNVDYPTVRVSSELVQREMQIISSRHMRDEYSAQTTYDGMDLNSQLEATKKWLKDTFPGQETEALLGTDKDGHAIITRLGVSNEQIIAAMAVQAEQRRAENAAAKIEDEILNRMIKEPLSSGPSGRSEPLRALPTPAQPPVDLTRPGKR
jgi:hypothetical protein